MASYRDVDQALKALLRQFGPPRKHVHPEFPFWRLRRDGVWDVSGAEHITVTPSGDAHVRSLRQENAHGGFPASVFALLQNKANLAMEIAYSLLEAHFPPSLHHDVLQAVGIDADFEHIHRRRRDSAFSNVVLTAYGHKCAVCAFAVRLGNRPVALEAAHIKWHRAGGPDQVRNALALCALHHRLFDAGAFTVSIDRKIMVAASVTGGGRDYALGRFQAKPLFLPTRDEDLPDVGFLKWHHREVCAAWGGSDRS
ncbi:MAG: HNH endonuclease [Gemmatimonadetes bacterium]|nr:HNH endonuclease [Gemmatimonadota bacterium]